MNHPKPEATNRKNGNANKKSLVCYCVNALHAEGATLSFTGSLPEMHVRGTIIYHQLCALCARHINPPFFVSLTWVFVRS